MQDHYSHMGFRTLQSEILDRGLCTGCSICTIMCRFENIAFDGRPFMKQDCVNCQLCTIVCPRANGVSPVLQKEWESHNKYALIRSARSTDEEILKVCQDGGVTTALLWHAMSKGFVNGAVVSGVKDLKPVPMIATTYEELLSSAGVRYSPSPTYQALLPLARSNGHYRRMRLGLVGTPCQVLALRNMQLPDMDGVVLEPSDHIEFIIGLFCMEQFDGELINYLGKKMDIQKAKKFKITKEGLNIIFSDGGKTIVGHDEINKFVRYNCRFCTDFTAMYADISVGNAGSGNGWTTVIIKSDIGRKLYYSALNEGFIVENEKNPNTGAIERLTKRKMKQVENLKNNYFR